MTKEPGSSFFLSDGLGLLKFHSNERFQIGNHNIDLKISNIYSKTVKTLTYEIEILDCEVKELLVGKQAFGESLGFDAAIQ
jgi:hypothetical protein